MVQITKNTPFLFGLCLVALWSLSGCDEAPQTGGGGSGVSQTITVRDGNGTPLSGATLYVAAVASGFTAQTTETGVGQESAHHSRLGLTDPTNGITCTNPPQAFSQAACTNSSGQATWICAQGATQSVRVFHNNTNLASLNLTCNGQAVTHNASASASPTPSPTATPVTTDVIIFSTESNAVYTTGNIGGRAGADTLCSNNKPTGVTQTKVRAFMCISATDEIRDMPSNYGVATNNRIRSPGGITMANNWADLLDGTIANSINTLFAASFGSQYTGCDSTNTGAIDAARNCLGFTDASGGALGTAANPSSTGANWMGTGFGSCSNGFAILCLAFD